MHHPRFALPRHLLALVLAAACLPAAAEKPVELPPLGLYRIDMDSTMRPAGQPLTMQQTTDGASGDTTARWKAGDRSVMRQFKGDGPVTHCVKAVTGGIAPPPSQVGVCSTNAFTRIANGFVQTAHCEFGTMTVTVHQLDKSHWEFLHDITLTTTGAAPNVGVLAPLLKQQAAQGATAEERERARQQLAALPRMQQQGDATYAAMVAKMNEELRRTSNPQERAAIQAALERMRPGTPTMVSHARAVWTRISDTCAGAE